MHMYSHRAPTVEFRFEKYGDSPSPLDLMSLRFSAGEICLTLEMELFQESFIGVRFHHG
jgi:hypothetical protein